MCILTSSALSGRLRILCLRKFSVWKQKNRHMIIKNAVYFSWPDRYTCFERHTSSSSLLLKASQWSFSTLNHHHFKVGKAHSAAVSPHEKCHFRTECLTLALSKLRICPWKAAGLLRAATENIFILRKFANQTGFLSELLQSDAIKIPAFIRWITVAVVLLTWHDALVHQLLPSSSLLKPQL